MKKGISREVIIKEAVQLVRERSYWALSLRDVAGRLCVKPASLYNHVDGIADIQISVAEYTADILAGRLEEAVGGRRDAGAIAVGATAFMDFARDNPELYKALIHAPKSDARRNLEIGKKTFDVFGKIIHGYGIDENNGLHLVRMLRCMMHGFFELWDNGFMSHGTVGRGESFRFMIDEFTSVVERYRDIARAKDGSQETTPKCKDGKDETGRK